MDSWIVAGPWSAIGAGTVLTLLVIATSAVSSAIKERRNRSD